MTLKEKIIATAKANWADEVGFAPASAFDRDDPIFSILPETKTVIGFVFRVLRGTYRGIEEGSTYYQYTTMGVENMEETIIPMALLKVAHVMEEDGWLALPQKQHQTIMNETDSTNPEVGFEMITRGASEMQMRYPESAVRCGLGEIGLSGALLTKRFGPMVRVGFLLTDAELEADEIRPVHLCDRCGECRRACPGHAIGEDGRKSPWQCAVYYNGANGSTNPFMPPDAYAGLDNRMDVITGKADLSTDQAKEVLADTYFYPPAQHSYTCSICGRACDRACYAHLEEKGILEAKFRRPFRSREPWKFSYEDFEKKETGKK